MSIDLAERVKQFAPAELATACANLLGVSSGACEAAIDATVHGLLSALAGRTSTPAGARDVTDVLTKLDLGRLRELAGTIGQSDQSESTGQGVRLAGQLMNDPARENLIGSVARAASIDRAQGERLLGLLTPVVAGALVQEGQAQRLDAAGLAALLAPYLPTGIPRPSMAMPTVRAAVPDHDEEGPPRQTLSDAGDDDDASPPAADPAQTHGDTALRMADEIPEIAKSPPRDLASAVMAGEPKAVAPPVAGFPVPMRPTTTIAPVPIAPATPTAAVAPATSVTPSRPAPGRETVERVDPISARVPKQREVRRGGNFLARFGWLLPVVVVAAASAWWLKSLFDADEANLPDASAVSIARSQDDKVVEGARKEPVPADRRETTAEVTQPSVVPVLPVVPNPGDIGISKPAEAGDAEAARRQAEAVAAARATRDADAARRQADADAAVKAARDAELARRPVDNDAAAKAARDAEAARRQAEADAVAKAARDAQAARQRAEADAAAKAARDAEAARRQAEADAVAKAARDAEAARRQAEADAAAKAARDAEAARRQAEADAAAKRSREAATGRPQIDRAVKDTRNAAATTAGAAAKVGSREDCERAVAQASAANLVRFEFASAKITRATQPVLRQLATTIRTCPSVRFRVEGYTDTDGHFDRNQRLSENRARAVVAYLERNGIEPRRLSSVGYGQSRPRVPNTTEANKQLNRRIEFAVEPN